MATRADMKKLIAEGNALIANCRQKRAERMAEDHEKLLAEVKALIANSRQRRADAPSREAHKKAEPFLTTAQWLSVICLAASLGGF